MTGPTHHCTPGRTARAGLLLSCFALFVTACDTTPDRTAHEDYPVFAEAATAQDLPVMEHSDNLVTDMELTIDEVRWVGEHEQTDFYAALAPSETDPDEQRVCFIIAAHGLDVAGASCSTDPYDPADPTVTVRVAGTGGALQAFLIPADTELEDADGWQRADEHVVVLTDPAAKPELTGTVAGDTKIVLRRITG